VQGIQGNGGKADERSENRSGTRRILGNGVRGSVDVTILWNINNFYRGQSFFGNTLQ